MDILSDPHVPFNAAVWCRTHKFHPTSVEVVRSLKSIASTRAGIAALEEQLADDYERLKAAVAKAEALLGESSNGY